MKTESWTRDIRKKRVVVREAALQNTFFIRLPHSQDDENSLDFITGAYNAYVPLKKNNGPFMSRLRDVLRGWKVPSLPLSPTNIIDGVDVLVKKKVSQRKKRPTVMEPEKWWTETSLGQREVGEKLRNRMEIKRRKLRESSILSYNENSCEREKNNTNESLTKQTEFLNRTFSSLIPIFFFFS